MKKLLTLYFFIPLALKTLNIQAFLTIFLNPPEFAIQVFAYSVLALPIIGAIGLIRGCVALPFQVKMWLLFYLIYFTIGLFANVVHHTEPHNLLKALIPVLFFISYSILFGSDFRIIGQINKWLMYLFLTTAIFTIFFDYLNFSLDTDGIYEFELDRAGGVYGDANNSSLSAILGFIYVYYIFKPKTKTGNLIKALGLLITLYAAVITFSKTGFIVLSFVAILLFLHSKVTKKLLIILLVPFFAIIGISYLFEKNILKEEQLARVTVLFDILSFETTKIDYSGRDALLENMINFVVENPLLGNGIQFSNLIRGHNTIIGVWADAGFFAFLIFLIIIASYFLLALSAPRDYRFFSLSIMVTLFFFMITLQTVITEAYLMVIFSMLSFILSKKHSKDYALIAEESE